MSDSHRRPDRRTDKGQRQKKRGQQRQKTPTKTKKTDSLNTVTYRQGLQPLFVELSLLTRHPEGEAGERGGERRTRGEIWEEEEPQSLSER